MTATKYCQIILSIIIVVVAFLYQRNIWIAYSRFDEQYMPNILVALAEEPGAKYMILNDNSPHATFNHRIIEYFDVGAVDDPSATVIINFHGYFTSAAVCSIDEDKIIAINSKRTENKIRMICPSTPGWGYSSPVRLRSFFDGLPLEFLRKLNVKKFHVMGMSFGTGDSIGLAINALLNKKEGFQVSSLTLNVPYVPSMGPHHAANNSIMNNIIYNPIIDRLFGMLLSNVNITDYIMNNPDFKIIAEKMNSNDENEKKQEQHKKDMIPTLLHQISRSIKIQWEGALDGYRLLRDYNLNNILYTNKKLLNDISKIVVFYGENDEVAGAHNADFLQRDFLPKQNSEFVMKKGGTHFDGGSDLETAIAKLKI